VCGSYLNDNVSTSYSVVSVGQDAAAALLLMFEKYVMAIKLRASFGKGTLSTKVA
jgi:hypothetical protein